MFESLKLFSRTAFLHLYILLRFIFPFCHSLHHVSITRTSHDAAQVAVPPAQAGLVRGWLPADNAHPPHPYRSLLQSGHPETP